jgi:hypothetical protein
MDSSHNRSVEKLVVVAILTTRNEKGELLKEEPSQPTTIFRGAQPDVWAWVDAEVQGDGK